MYMRKTFIRELVEYYLSNYPRLTNKQIHQLAGTSQSYVSVLRNKLGYQRISDGRATDEIRVLVDKIPKRSHIIKAIEKTWRFGTVHSKRMQMLEIHHYANKYAGNELCYEKKAPPKGGRGSLIS